MGFLTPMAYVILVATLILYASATFFLPDYRFTTFWHTLEITLDKEIGEPVTVQEDAYAFYY